jgi:hypothetical protein
VGGARSQRAAPAPVEKRQDGRRRRFAMGDKGKKDREKEQRQHAAKEQERQKKKLEATPAKRLESPPKKKS